MTSVTPPRRRTPSDDVEQALLDAAAVVLTSEGPSALSVRRVAADAGCSPMGVYSRFGGKRGLVEALFLDGFRRLEEALTVARTHDPIADLQACCRAYRRFALDSPAAYSVMFARAVPDFVPSPPCKADAGCAFEAVVDLVRVALDAGELRPRDPVDVAEGIWATCHGLVSLELAGIGFVADRAAHYDHITAALLRGLGSDQPQARRATRKRS